jgi:hypothetical protein
VRDPSGLLFGGRHDAFTRSIAYVEAPFAAVVAASTECLTSRNSSTEFLSLETTLEAGLGELELSSAAISRSLWIETAGEWTALFDCSAEGLEQHHMVSDRLKCRALRTGYDPHVTSNGKVVRAGSCVFELSQGGAAWDSDRARSISAAYQTHWKWQISGTPLPFEDHAAYDHEQINSRFDLPMLTAYCRALGIDRDEPSFYGPRALLALIDTSYRRQ